MRTEEDGVGGVGGSGHGGKTVYLLSSLMAHYINILSRVFQLLVFTKEFRVTILENSTVVKNMCASDNSDNYMS